MMISKKLLTGKINGTEGVFGYKIKPSLKTDNYRWYFQIDTRSKPDTSPEKATTKFLPELLE